MRMRSREYWADRAARMMYEQMADAEDTADQIAAFYQKSARYLSLQMEGIFEKYQTKYGLPEKEARQLLSHLQSEEDIQALLQALRNGDSGQSKTELLQRLEAPAYAARIDRLQQLQNQLNLVMQNIYQQEKAFSTNFYLDFARKSYYQSVYQIQQQAGVAFSFSHVSAKQINQAVKSKWSGKNYSARIWGNTQTLAKELKEELTISLITGRTERETADIIANKFAQGARAARRLIRTESNYLSGQMELESYRACEIDRYIYVAVLDLRTSKVCADLDNKVFLVSEAKVGANYPPMHPWCRSTTIAYVSDEIREKWTRSARDPVTGKTVQVPAKMTYHEWYEKYVAGNPAAQAEETKIKSRAADRVQYKKYRKILGDEIPESFAKFQELKYNNPEKWNLLKGLFRKQHNKNTAFEQLSEPLQLKHVRKVLSDMGVAYDHVKISIERNPELIGSCYYGWTNPNGKEVQLYPDAFASRECLVKTLGHERVHIEQIKLWGPAKTAEEAMYYEKGPRFSEDYWWDEYRRRTNYDGK